MTLTKSKATEKQTENVYIVPSNFINYINVCPERLASSVSGTIHFYLASILIPVVIKMCLV